MAEADDTASAARKDHMRAVPDPPNVITTVKMDLDDINRASMAIARVLAQGVEAHEAGKGKPSPRPLDCQTAKGLVVALGLLGDWAEVLRLARVARI